MANAMIIKSSAAGKMGPAATEVFNDYNNNKAGIKGYYFTQFIVNEDKTATIYLGAAQTSTPTIDRDLNFEINYTEGDIISYIYGSKFYDSGKIISIDNTNKSITVEPASESIVFKAGDWGIDIDDQILFVYAKPLNGIVHFGHYAHAEGENTIVAERAGHAEGRETVVRGQYGHAEGRQTEAHYAAHAEGRKTKALGEMSHAEGFQSESHGYYSHAEGRLSKAMGQNSHAEGLSTEALGQNSHAEGRGTIATIDCQHVQGKFNIKDTAGDYAHIVGWGTGAGREKNIHTLTTDGDAWFAGDVYIGSSKNKLANIGKSGTGDKSEIFNNYNNNTAAGGHAHAEGSHTSAAGGSAHAEGFGTSANGTGAHSEGHSTVADGYASHAEGHSTYASNYSHAEGFGSKVTISGDGYGAHAEGRSTLVSAEGGHAEGFGTKASSPYQHVQGRYNIEDKEGLYAHIVGWGEAASTPKNIHTLTTDGNGWFAGTVETTGIVLKSPNGTKWLVTIDNEGNLITTQK